MYDWYESGPIDPFDQFSIRWAGEAEFDEALYAFYLTTNDGMRLFIDDQLVYQKWFIQSPTNHAHYQYMSPGMHTLKVEYFEAGGIAAAKVAWQKLTTYRVRLPLIMSDNVP